MQFLNINFDSAFKPRAATYYLTDASLLRVAVAYRTAKADRRGSSALYRVGNEWSPIYDNFMGNFIEALLGDDLQRLRSMLENFFRESFSNGLHGLHFEMAQRYMTPGRVIAEADYLAYVHTVSADLDLLSRMMPDLDINNIHMPLAGNPYGVEVGGRFFYGPHFLYFAKKIYMLTGSDATRVVELGAGYGGLPWAIRNCMPNSRYVEFDLPEVLAIASFYILSTYPKTNIALFGEVDLQSAELDNFDFIFMPNFEIERMPSNWSDVSFNSWSLAEMEAEAIGNYVRHLGRVTRRYFFHVNHVVHSKISSDVFPVNFRKFRLLHRAPSMWGKSLHRNNFVDEHEFIYEVRS